MEQLSNKSFKDLIDMTKEIAEKYFLAKKVSFFQDADYLAEDDYFTDDSYEGFLLKVEKAYLCLSEAEQNLMSTLYDYMAYLRNPQTQSVDSVISNQFIGDFFESIIDGCVYELFFKDHMKERGIDIIDFLYDMIRPIENTQETSEIIASVFNTLYKTDNEVRTRLNLFVSRSSEYLKTIIQS